MNLLELRIIGVLSIICVLYISYISWHHHVWQEGFDACQAAQTKAVEEGKKQYEKTAQKVKRLPDDHLRREFCKWVRDADMPACLRDLPAFRP